MERRRKCDESADARAEAQGGVELQIAIVRHLSFSRAAGVKKEIGARLVARPDGLPPTLAGPLPARTQEENLSRRPRSALQSAGPPVDKRLVQRRRRNLDSA
jgi:hypothetical protein